MKITIEIPDDELKQVLLDHMVRSIISDGFDTRHTQKLLIETVQKMIYEPEVKASIIEKATNKAALEIKRKAMPELMKKLTEGG